MNSWYNPSKLHTLKESLQNNINQAQVTFEENLVRDYANGNS